MKKILFLLVISMSTNALFSQNMFSKNIKPVSKSKEGYNITGNVIGLKDSTVMLAYYFGGKQYAVDTAVVNNGSFTFTGNENLKGGIYLIVMSDNKYFDLIVSEQHFSFTTDFDNLIGAMVFTNSIENPPFYNYLNFITKMQKEVTPLRQKIDLSKGDEKVELQKEIDKIDLEVKKYRKEFIKINDDKFFSKIVIATTEPIIPKAPKDADKSFQFRYYKKHFWDNIDFSDERMLRTPIFFNKMDQFLEKLTAKHPDSINISADILIENSRANKDIFQYVVSYITSTYERSKIMGMDAVFVHMVEKYYITNQ